MNIKFGIIGAGMIGSDHATRINKSLNGGIVTAVNDINIESAKRLVAELGTAEVFEDPYDLIRSPEVNAILVCSIGSTHEEFVLASIAAGKYVFCEKPLATSASACKNIVDAEMNFGKRLVHNILPETEPANSLLVVECYTDQGNTSSYPSHKHDTDDFPNETYLEETYYHRFNPKQGFAFQRVYTEDGSLDESMAVYDKDVVMVPKGYHPVATIAGYDNYYLNVMAGPVRKWCFTWEDDHDWINGETYN